MANPSTYALELRELRKAVRTQMMYSRRQAASHSR